MRVIRGAAGVVLAAATLAAMDMTMDRAAVDAAVTLGQSRIDRDRLRFHADYRIAINRAPIDYVEVVTPFRRVVLAAETRARTGDRSFGQRQALELLAAAEGQFDVRAEVTFHPLNNYVDVPEYRVTLEERRTRPTASPPAPISPRASERLARFGPRVDGTSVIVPVPGAAAGGQSQPLLGGTIVAHFDGRVVNPSGVYEVVVSEAGKELGRAPIDFGKLR